MVVTPDGMVISLKAKQLSKAPFPMEVRLFGKSGAGSFEQQEKAQAPIDVTPSGMFMFVRTEQQLKVYLPIDVTPFSRLTVLRPVQSKKTLSPNVLTLPGMLTFSNSRFWAKVPLSAVTV